MKASPEEARVREDRAMLLTVAPGDHYIAAMRFGPLLQSAASTPTRRDVRAARDSPGEFTETGPTVTATLRDGPLQGRRIDVEVIEGRPPKIINVPVDHAKTCRYCLAAWAQSGPSAIYTFLYRV